MRVNSEVTLTDPSPSTLTTALYTIHLSKLTVDLGILLILRHANGYNSDLALYYKRVKSWGVVVELLRED